MTQLAKSTQHIQYGLLLKDVWDFWDLAMYDYWEVKGILTDFWFEERDGKTIDSNIKAAMESELARRKAVCTLIEADIDRLEKESGIDKIKPHQGPKK